MIKTIKKSIHSVLETKPLWLNSITDTKTLFLIAVSNGMASQVSIDLSDQDDLIHYYRVFQHAQIDFYSNKTI
jgi:hypothetical protein